LEFFESGHSTEPIFCFDVTRQQQGAFMHNSTLIVLVILTIGQMLMMTFGALILWMMGDLGGAPGQRDDSSRQAGQNLVHVPQEAVVLVEESSDELINSGEEGSIAPKPAEDQADHEAQHPGRARGKAA
jgi:hypothetical protein